MKIKIHYIHKTELLQKKEPKISVITKLIVERPKLEKTGQRVV